MAHLEGSFEFLLIIPRIELEIRFLYCSVLFLVEINEKFVHPGRLM